MTDTSTGLSAEQIAELKRRKAERDQRSAAFIDQRNAALETDAPDDAAYDIKKSEELGIPREAIGGAREEYRAEDMLAGMEKMRAQSPRTSEWMRTPDNYAVAKDEADLWGSVEKEFGNFRKDLDTVAGYFKKTSDSLKPEDMYFAPAVDMAKGAIRDPRKAATEVGDMGRSLASAAPMSIGSISSGLGTFLESAITTYDKNIISNIPVVNRAVGEAKAWEAQFMARHPEFAKAVAPYAGPSQILKTYGAQGKAIQKAWEPETMGFEDKVAQGLGQLVVQVGMAMATGGSSAGLTASAAQAQAAASAGISTTMFMAMGVDQQAEMMRAAGVDPNDKLLELASGAAITGSSEMLRLDRVMKILPPEVRNRVARSVVGRVAGQAFEEGIQEGVENALHNFIATSYDPNATILGGVGEAAAVGGTVGGVFQAIIELAMPGKARAPSAQEINNILKDVASTQPSAGDKLISGVMEKFAKANLGKRSPEKAADLVNKIVEGTGAETVVIDLDGLAQSLTTAGMDVRETLTQLGVDPDAIGELGQLMGTAEIPMGRLAAPSAQLLSAQIIPHMRLATEDLTPFQKTELEDIAELAKRYTTELKEDIARDASKLGAFVDVQEQIYTAAKASGLNLTEEQYRHNANVEATRVAYVAMKRGQDVRETFAELGPKIMGRDGAAQGSAALEQKADEMRTRLDEAWTSSRTMQPKEAARVWKNAVEEFKTFAASASAQELIAASDMLLDRELLLKMEAPKLEKMMKTLGLPAPGPTMALNEMRDAITAVLRSANSDQAESSDPLAQSLPKSMSGIAKMTTEQMGEWYVENVQETRQDFPDGTSRITLRFKTDDAATAQDSVVILQVENGKVSADLVLRGTMGGPALQLPPKPDVMTPELEAERAAIAAEIRTRSDTAMQMFRKAIVAMRHWAALEQPSAMTFSGSSVDHEKLYNFFLSRMEFEGYTNHVVEAIIGGITTRTADQSNQPETSGETFVGPMVKFVVLKDGEDLSNYAETEASKGRAGRDLDGNPTQGYRAVTTREIGPSGSSVRGLERGGSRAGETDPGGDGTDAENLTQPRRGGYDPKTREMSFSGISDASTFLHENSHWFLATLEELAPTEKWAADDLAEINSWYQSIRETPKMQQIRARYSVVPDPAGGVRIMYQPPADMAGETPAAMRLERVATMEEAQAKIEWRERQEAWAETTEEYFMTGESPTPRLKQILRDFKQWLVGVYRGMLPGERANLTPEIKSMMDRILAVDVEVDAASAEAFRDARKMADEMLGKGIITPRQHKLVGDRLDKAREEVKEELLARVMQEKLDAAQASRATERSIILGDLARAFDKSPVGRAFNWLAYGEWKGDLPGEPATEGEAETARSDEMVFQGGTLGQGGGLYQLRSAFYSALTRFIENSSTVRAPAAQWISMINNASGLKAEEIEWSGLMDWLEMSVPREGSNSDGIVSRDEILEYLSKRGIKMQLVIAGDRTPDVPSRPTPNYGVEDLEWDDGETWDDREAYEYDIDYYINDYFPEDLQGNTASSRWEAFLDEAHKNYLEDNLEEIRTLFNLPEGDISLSTAIADNESYSTVLQYIEDMYDQTERDEWIIDNNRSYYEDLAEEYARESYFQNNPIIIYEAETNENGRYMTIFGNSDQGFNIFYGRRGAWRNYGDRINTREIYSYAEAQVQAHEYAVDNDLLDLPDNGEEDVEDNVEEAPTPAIEGETPAGSDLLAGVQRQPSTKWSSYQAPGPKSNYREFKIMLPEIPGSFVHTTHFSDKNIVAFMRVSDRQLAPAAKTAAPARAPAYPTTTLRFDFSVAAGRVAIFDAAGNRLTEIAHMGEEDLMRRFNEYAAQPDRRLFTTDDGVAAVTVGDGQTVMLEPPNKPAQSPQPSASTFYIDELQSDWHQQGRQKIYDTPAERARAEGMKAKLLADVTAADMDRSKARLAAHEALDAALPELPGETQNITYRLQSIMSNALKEVTKEGVPVYDDAIIRRNLENYFEKIEPGSVSDRILGVMDLFKAERAKEVALQNLEKKLKKVQDALANPVPNVPFKGDAWISLSIKQALIAAVAEGKTHLAWADSGVLKKRWSDRYSELYENTYDKKAVKATAKVAGVQPVHVENAFAPGQGYWIVPITEQVKDIITDPEKGLSLFQTKAPIFYSALSRFIENSKTTKAPASQWRGMITNAPGIKVEEVEMSGVMDWLDLQQGPVTREALAAFVAANGVTVEEVKYSSSLTDNPRLDAIQREMLPLLEENDRLMGEINDLGSSPEADALRETFNRNVELINDLRSERFQIVNSDVDSTKWSSYTLPGGENYTELLLTVPGVDYKDSHFPGVKGTIAHVRLKERIGPNGERVLALEEIQSGIHQKGREDGYDKSGPFRVQFEADAAKLKAELKASGVWDAFSSDMMDPSQKRPFNPEEESSYVWSSTFEGWLQFNPEYNAHKEASLALGEVRRAIYANQGAVPNAPFKNNAWVDLVLKRMIRYAAENKFDSVAWIPGNVQNGKVVEADDNRSDFYDKIVPNAANKLGKKYGARVGQLDFPEAGGRFASERELPTGRPERVVTNDYNGQLTIQLSDGTFWGQWPVANRDMAERRLARLQAEYSPIQFHSLPITPELREAALNEGFPLFQPRKFNPPGHGAVAPPADIPPVRLDLKLVKDLYGEEAVRKLPAAVRQRSSTSSNVTDIIQQIEAVRKVLSVKRKGPQTLTQFIMQRQVKQQDGTKRNRQWGIKGADGELRAMGLERLINEKSGMTLDAMRELAEEAGFIRAETGGARATEYGDFDATPNDLLDALAREAKGENVVRIGEETENKELDDAKTWASWLEQNGVDIYEADKKKLRASVEQMLRDTDESLVSPDKAAEMFGFANGEELLKALAEVGNRDQYLNKMADQKMVEEFGDMMTDGTLQAEAAEAARLDIAHRQTEIELEALARAVGQQASANYAKSLARDIIAMRTVKEIAAYERDLNNERQFGKQALRLVEKGDYPAALKAKQRQLVSMQLYIEGKKASEKIEKRRLDLMKYLTSEGRRDKIAGDYLEKIEDILDRFELRVSKQGPSVQRERMSAAKYVADMDAAGRQDEVAPEARLLAELNEKMVWRNMTSAEVDHLVGTIQNLAHLGRTKDSLLKAAEKRKFRAVIDALTDRMNLTGKLPGVTRERSPTKTTTEVLVDTLREGHSWLMRPEHQARSLDGGELGPVWEAIFRPISEAGDVESRMMREATQLYREAWDKFTGAERNAMTQRSISVPELPGIGKRFTKMDLISVALNWGVIYNREVLMEGYGWNAEQVEAALFRVLTDKDWDFVESIWEISGMYKAEAFQVEKDMTGVEPKSVEGIPFTLPSGRKINGKYYHIQYDASQPGKMSRRQAKDNDAEALSSHRKSRTKAMTKNGGLIERKGSGGRKVKLGLAVFEKALAETVHDIAFRRAVYDVGRIVADDQFADTYQEVAGMEAYRQLNVWLKDVAMPPMEVLDPIVKAFAHVRRNVPLAVMGYKIGTALIQPTGLLAAMPLVGHRRVLVAVAKSFANPDRSMYGAWKQVASMSEFMRDRVAGYERDVRETTTAMTKGGALDVMRRNAFTFITGMDIAVSVPTWMAAYGKAMDGKVKGIDAGNQEDAVAFADSIIRRTQTAGKTQDLSRFQRGGEFQKQVSMIFGYFNNLYSLTAQQTLDMRRGNLSKAQYAWHMTVLFVVIPLFAELLAGRLIPDDDDEDEATIEGNIATTLISNFSGMFPGIRDVVALNLKPEFGYRMSPTAKFAEDIGKTLGLPAQLMLDEERELTEADVKRAVNAAGAVTGLPAAQINITGNYIIDVLEGEEDPMADPADAASEALVRNTR